MPQNLELKARCVSLRDVLKIARRLSGRHQSILHQKDIYYQVPKHRLKLRIIDGNISELIFYRRPNRKGGRYSDYLVLPISDPENVDEFYSSIYGRRIIVRKKRILFLYKNARIHIDTVRGLGTFIEFEVLVSEGRVQAEELFKFLYQSFRIKHIQLCASSYSDLLVRKKSQYKQD